MERFLLIVEQVEPVATIPATAVSDPKDVMVLAAAVGGRADYIVSGDKHLLTLGAYEGIPILRVADLLQRLNNSTA